MHFPHLFVSAALAALAVSFAGAASAQFQPPPYSYPPGGYRGVPDRDGVIRADPNDDLDDVEPRAPQGGRYGTAPNDQAAAPYPYDPRAGRRLPPEQQPYDPRYGGQAYGGQSYGGQDGRQVGPAPGASPSPNYDTNYNSNSGYATQRPYGHMPADPGYAPRPNDAPPVSLQPNPDAQPRPPAPLAPPRQAFPPFPNIFAPQPQQQAQPPQQVRPNTVAALPAEDQPEENPKELPQQFKRQIVPYASKEPAGTLIIDTNSTYLYYVQGDGTAIRYGIGVGREGFTWAGAEKVSRMAEWPDWHPPAEMIERQPYLPRFMAGGDGNPLGARALYLGKTIYRIHGTNQPSTIGKFVSSGCIRMLNADVEDLYTRVKVGTRVVVLPGSAPASASSSAPITR